MNLKLYFELNVNISQSVSWIEIIIRQIGFTGFLKVLLIHIFYYSDTLPIGRNLTTSGFYLFDLNKIRNCSRENGLKFIRNFIINKSVAIEFKKLWVQKNHKLKK